MTARERSVATLALHALELTTSSLVPDLAISGNKKKTTILGRVIVFSIIYILIN